MKWTNPLKKIVFTVWPIESGGVKNELETKLQEMS